MYNFGLLTGRCKISRVCKVSNNQLGEVGIGFVFEFWTLEKWPSWFKASVSKTDIWETVSRVQIPPSPIYMVLFN